MIEREKKMTKEMDKFVMPRNNGTRVGGQKQYPRIRISMVAYAHVCEMSEETRRSLSEVASRAIEYAYSHLVYSVPTGREYYYRDTPITKQEYVTDDPETIERVNDIIRKSGLSRSDLELLLDTVQLLPGFDE